MPTVIQLYQSSGAEDFTIQQDGLTHDQCGVLFGNAARLASARNQFRAAKLVRSIPFRIVEATNHFNDEFSMLYAVVPLDEYERLRRGMQDPTERLAFKQIADVLSEVGTHVRFVAVELASETPVHVAAQASCGLKRSEISKVVNDYIGVSGGYLGDFTYPSHHEFYVQLDLDIDPNERDGTTRERFIKILGESAPDVQARILEGVLERFQVDSSELRTPERADKMRGWVARLRSGPHVEQPVLRITSEVVERALQDAQELLRATGATSGVDRLHTALHGYLRDVCASTGLEATDEALLTGLFKQIRAGHPAFRDLGPRADDIVRILRAMATILDSLNPLRNKASVAHPNTALLPEAEAMLAINAARSILRYVDDKVHHHAASEG